MKRKIETKRFLTRICFLSDQKCKQTAERGFQWVVNIQVLKLDLLQIKVLKLDLLHIKKSLSSNFFDLIF